MRFFFGRTLALSCALAIFGSLAFSNSALAVPAFARKYGTSCQTCHTIYPKLSPFGEAFRRDGYRFPGADGDFVKQDVVPLGQDAQKQQFPNSVWPGSVPASVPLALGFNGEAVFHPQTSSSAGTADNNARFSLKDLISEGHVWAGGSFDDKTTFFGELTFSDAVEIEHALVIFNDLVGPKHAVNLKVGKDSSTISSFGQHSSYVGDFLITPLTMTALYGSGTDSWNLTNNYPGVEVNGVINGIFDYSIGINAGSNKDLRGTENFYVHAGTKFGGLPLDGEGSSSSTDATKPWTENSVSVDGFFYRAKSVFTDSAAADFEDTAYSFGGHVRGQWQSFELNTGIYQERHDHATTGGGKVSGITQYNELSYVVFPWLIPAFRVELSRLSPSGTGSFYDLRVIPGIAALVRPNLRLGLVAQIEKASGAPDGGWGAAGGAAGAAVGTEMEAVMLNMAFAF